MALVVLEGLDKTGKSTVANALATAWRERHKEPTQIVHCGAPNRAWAIDEALEPIDEYVPGISGTRKHVVFDRSFVGEAVWPSFFTRKPAFTPREFALLAQAYTQKGALFVKATRPMHEIVEEFRKGEEPLPITMIPGAKSMFDLVFEWLKKYGAYVTTWDFDSDPEGDAIRSLSDRIESQSYDGEQRRFGENAIDYETLALAGLRTTP